MRKHVTTERLPHLTKSGVFEYGKVSVVRGVKSEAGKKSRTGGFLKERRGDGEERTRHHSLVRIQGRQGRSLWSIRHLQRRSGAGSSPEWRDCEGVDGECRDALL